MPQAKSVRPVKPSRPQVGRVSRLMVGGVFVACLGAATLARADCPKPPDPSVCFPAYDGVLTETTSLKVGVVRVNKTDDMGHDRDPIAPQPDPSFGKVSNHAGTYTLTDGTGSISIPEELKYKISADTKLPDIHQSVTDDSSSWTGPTGKKIKDLQVDTVPSRDVGATNDLMIESVAYSTLLGRYFLIDDFGTIARKIGLFIEVGVPDLYADTNGDGSIGPGDVLYSLVDLNIYLDSVPSFSLGDHFSIVGGTVAGLPGMMFSTTPFVFDPLTGFSTTGAFSGAFSSAFTGDGVVLARHGMTATVPEPGEWALLMVGFCLLGLTIRRTRTEHSA